MHQKTSNRCTSRRLVDNLASSAGIALLLLLAIPVHATVDIPNVPLQSGTFVPPNVLFILDDSGSMAWDAMGPGTSESTMLANLPDVSPKNINRYTSAINSMFYDPTKTYEPWRNADATRMTGGQSFTGAYSSDTLASGDSDRPKNQNTDYFSFYVLTGTNRLASSSYVQYRATAVGIEKCLWDSNIKSWRNCTDMANLTWGAVTRTAAAELKNIATWYSYHRTRSKTAKAAAGEAFSALDEKYRVGYNSIWNRGTFNIPVGRYGGLFSDIDDSGNRVNNRTDWFAKLYAADARDGTPLHAALKRAGDYFSDSSASGPWGPGTTAVDQISCRQNFTILTTDGYWNNKSTVAGNEDNTAGTVYTNANGTLTGGYAPALPYSDGYTNTLADAAMKYWKTDLRTDLDNNVPSSPDDPAFWQHMVTFAISIGLKGTLDPRTDLPAIKAGTKSWPDPMAVEDDRRIDDLWHAAINGRGEFVAATNPDELAQALRDALSKVTERTGSASNVSVNGTRVVDGTKVYQASYLSGSWSGELKAYSVTDTSVVPTPIWSAASQIPAPASRKIYTRNGAVGVEFKWAALSTTQQTALGGPSNGPLVLDYLRGVRTQEENNGGTYRNRNNALGDIIDSSPAFSEYDPDNNSLTDNSIKTVFVGANDGMLHAFDAQNGSEKFAYVPGATNYADLASLANKNYEHKYFVDGQIVVSTPQQTPGRSILIGAMGRGGKSLYALDVTNPAAFSGSDVLWEFGDLEMGNVLGQPVIAKLNNGKTAVIVGNGYNSAGGKSAVYVIDITDGSLIAKFDSGRGSTTLDNGMSSPTVWDINRDGAYDYIYAGDLLGNLWKIDITSTSSAAWKYAFGTTAAPQPLYSAGATQPITGEIAIGLDPTSMERWVFFGTGRYLTNSDPTSAVQQAWYGIKDTRVTVASSEVVTRTISVDTAGKRSFPAGVTGDMTGKKGWKVPLSTFGAVKGAERMVSGQVFWNGVLIASSIIPSKDSCASGGSGYINVINPFTGTAVEFFDMNGDGKLDDNDKVGASWVGGSGTVSSPVGSIDPGVGMPSTSAVVYTGNDGNVSLLTGGSGNGQVAPPNLQKGHVKGVMGRVSWRERVSD